MAQRRLNRKPVRPDRAAPSAPWSAPPPPPLHPLPPGLPAPWACAWGEDDSGLWQAFEVQGVRQVLRWIPPGEFWMGSPDEEPERYPDERHHLVVLTQGLWMADTACTQALWRAVLGEDPSRFGDDPENPVEQVSWNDIVQRFLPALNALVPGLQAGLPTEAQWEYACRAGTDTPFWFGPQVTTAQVNHDGNYPYAGGPKGEYRERTVPVKALPANGWGLYQMHGNVWEWCADVYGDYPEGPAIDPRGPVMEEAGANVTQGTEGVVDAEGSEAAGRQRVLRGGCWIGRGGGCRSAGRVAREPDGRLGRVGFRLARGPC